VWARGKRTRGAARKKTGQHAESGREEECYYEEREGKKIEREKIRLAAHVQREERREKEFRVRVFLIDGIIRN